MMICHHIEPVATCIRAIACIQVRTIIRRLLHSWSWRTHLFVLKRRVCTARKLAITGWRAQQGALLHEAADKHDSKETWRLSRSLAGTGCFAKRRWRGQVCSPCPPIQDWKQHLEQPGFSGGQSAHTLWTGDSWVLPHALQLGSELLEPPNFATGQLLHSFNTPTSSSAGD